MNDKTRDFDWSPPVDVDVVLGRLRSAVFGDIPAYVLTSDGRRAKGSDLWRLKDEMAEALEVADGRNMIGYSIVFNRWAEVNDGAGPFLERVMPGAAAKSLRERGDRIVVQFDHGHHPLVGSIPIAAPRAVWEDDEGLFAWDRLHSSWLFEPVREAISSGAIKGQSFRFSVPEGGDRWEYPDGDLPRCSLSSVNIRERGPVVWPAYLETSVAVRELVRAMPTELRDAASAAGRGMVTVGTGDSTVLVGIGAGSAADHDAGQVQGITRRDMCERALTALGICNADQDRNAS